MVIIGTGPSVKNHKIAIEQYIEFNKPYVIALNTQEHINEELIDIRVACHPTKLLVDLHKYPLLKRKGDSSSKSNQ